MKRLSNDPPSEIIPLAKIQYEQPPKLLRKNVENIKTSLKEHGQVKVSLILSTSRPHLASRKKPKNPLPSETKLGMFTVRSGAAELEAARELGWKEIRAIVIPEESPSPDVIPEWTKLLEKHLTTSLSDYEIAEAAIDMEKRYQVGGGTFASILGVSKPYAYNLMRWYRHAPPQVREAWKEKHPLINHAELESYTHMTTSEEVVRAWKNRVLMRSSGVQPFKPGRNGYARKEDVEYKPRRASEKKIEMLLTSVEESQLLKPVKELCVNILKYVLGARQDVPGLTRKTKLHHTLSKEPPVS